MLSAALHAVLLDFKAADTGEIDCLVIGTAARAERVEVLGAGPPLEDIDPGGIQRIGRDREVKATRCLAGEAHSTNAGSDMSVSVRRIEDEVTGNDEHPPIVPTTDTRERRTQDSTDSVNPTPGPVRRAAKRVVRSECAQQASRPFLLSERFSSEGQRGGWR